jgi:hypothetical protein
MVCIAQVLVVISEGLVFQENKREDRHGLEEQPEVGPRYFPNFST